MAKRRSRKSIRARAERHCGSWATPTVMLGAEQIRMREIITWLAGYDACQRDIRSDRQFKADRARSETASRREFFRHPQPCTCVMCS